MAANDRAWVVLRRDLLAVRSEVVLVRHLDLAPHHDLAALLSFRRRGGAGNGAGCRHGGAGGAGGAAGAGAAGGAAGAAEGIHKEAVCFCTAAETSGTLDVGYSGRGQRWLRAGGREQVAEGRWLRAGLQRTGWG